MACAECSKEEEVMELGVESLTTMIGDSVATVKNRTFENLAITSANNYVNF
jgi:hypothetical protein